MAAGIAEFKPVAFDRLGKVRWLSKRLSRLWLP